MTSPNLQHDWEIRLEDYKDVLRYWHSVLTLELPIHYAVVCVLSLSSFIYFGTRDWTAATTFFIGLFVYFAGALVMDFVGGMPWTKFVKNNYEGSENDPYKIVAKYAAQAQERALSIVEELREFRRANSTLFTVQVCGASLVMAFFSSFFSGFTLLFLTLLTLLAAPPIIVHQLHVQAWAKLQPIVEPQILMLRQKLGVYVPALAPKSASSTASADKVKKEK